MNISAGLLMYNSKKEVFLVHLGGPYWAHKDSWSIPKGHVEIGEDLFDTAKREFFEETGITVPETEFIKLGVFMAPNKEIYVWAFEDKNDSKFISSNKFNLEYPKNSGNFIEVEENDHGQYFSLAEAKNKIFKAQALILDVFNHMVKV